jgi:hypothetical protein
MIGTLLRKELTAHWLPFLGLFLIAGTGFLVLLLGSVMDDTPFRGLRLFLLFVAPLVTYGLSSRLVAQEYAGRTQLFLETLPVSRVHVLVVKLLLGCTLFFGVVFGATALTVLVDTRTVVPTSVFLGIIFVRVAAYGLFLHATCFLLNLLGRYRVACLLMMLVAVVFIETETSLEVDSRGPFGLLDPTLGLERELLVVGDVGWTLLTTAAFLALAFVLALGREGSVAAMLGHDMSYREKAFIASGLVSTLFLVLLVGEKIPNEPFDIPQAVEAGAPGIQVRVALGGAVTWEEATALAERTRDELVELREYLDVEDFPTVFVVSWPGLDAGTYDVGHVDDAEGLILRIHMGDPSWREERYLSWLVWELLRERTHGRVLRDGKRWLHDGFGLYWVSRGGDDPRGWDLAAYAAPEGLRTEWLDAWNRYREQLGVDLAREVACSGLRVLAEERGSDTVRALVRRVVAADVPQDVRALFHPTSAPLASQFDEHCGISYDAFVDRWNSRLAAVRTARSEEISRIPRLTAALSFYPVSELSYELRFRLQSIPPLADEAEVQFRWKEIGPFDKEIHRHEERVHEVPYRVAVAERALHQLLPRGARVAWRMSTRIEGVEAELSTGWQRVDVR